MISYQGERRGEQIRRLGLTHTHYKIYTPRWSSECKKNHLPMKGGLRCGSDPGPGNVQENDNSAQILA